MVNASEVQIEVDCLDYLDGANKHKALARPGSLSALDYLSG